MMFATFNANKIKSQLKMAISRINIASNQKSALMKQDMRSVALLLGNHEEEKARIKVEALIRDDNMVEALDLVQLQCEILLDRISIIEFENHCPADLISCVSTIIYAAPRLGIPELVEVRKQLRAKYGKPFKQSAMNNVDGIVNERIVEKLSIQPLDRFVVQDYLEKICALHGVDWTPLAMCDPIQPPTSSSSMDPPLVVAVPY